MDRLKKIIIFLIASIPPITFSLFFDTKFLLVTFISLTYCFFILRYSNLFLIITTIVLLITIYLSFIIIPFSFYTTWLKQIVESLPKGRITFLIVSISIISYVVSTLDIIRDYKSIFKSVTIILLFLSFVLGKLTLLLYLPVIISLYIASNIFIYSKKNSLKLLILLFLITVFSLIISNKIEVNGSYTINNLSYRVRDILIKNFPEIDLLTSIPGSDGLSKSRGKAPLLTSNKLFKIWGNPGESYYLRLKIDSDSIKEEKIDISKLFKPDIGSLKVEVLSDFLPIVPTLSSGKFNSTITPDRIISKYDKLYLSRSNGTEIYDISDYFLTTGVVDEEIIELSKKLKGKDDRETLSNIRSYLWDNFQYSTETENSIDFIKNFLLYEKKGFCIHFTKSFILLARLNNISSREVSGYYKYIKRPENGNYQGFEYITGKNSHMWPEVYINNNWETFEVTPGYINKTTSSKKASNIIEKSSGFESSEKIKKINYYWLIFVIICPLLIILFKNLLTSPIKKLVNKGLKMGVKHPNEIGWVRWNSEIFGSLDNLEVFLNYSYKKGTLSKKDRITLNSLRKLF